MTAEEWRPIPGEKFYEASSWGRVRMIEHTEQTANRWGPMTRRRGPKVLRQGMRGEYLACSVCNRPQSVHVLVALAFHGARPDGKVVNHIDHDRMNNTPENLEWVTTTENNRHSLRCYKPIDPSRHHEKCATRSESARKQWARRLPRYWSDYIEDYLAFRQGIKAKDLAARRQLNVRTIYSRISMGEALCGEANSR